MEGISRPESVEKETRTRILVLETRNPGGLTNYTLVKIPQGFNIEAAKAEFDEGDREPREKLDRDGQWQDPTSEHERFKEWLIQKGLAEEIDIEKIQEDTM